MFGYSDLYAIQATPPLLKFGPPTEIDFFDVSDDLDQKKNFFFGTKKFMDLVFNFFSLRAVHMVIRRNQVTIVTHDKKLNFFL